MKMPLEQRITRGCKDHRDLPSKMVKKVANPAASAGQQCSGSPQFEICHPIAGKNSF